MKTYKAYLFDWDGTLAATTEIWLDVLKQALLERGITVNDHDNAHHLGDLFWYVGLGILPGEVPTFIDDLHTAANLRLPMAKLYDNAEQTLMSLHESGKKIAIITTTPRQSLDITLKQHNISGFIDYIVTADDVAHNKPDPEGILLALEKFNVSAKDAVMTGDNYKDILAAHNAQVDSALFYPESHKAMYDLAEIQQHHPTYVIALLNELLAKQRAPA